MNSFALKSPVQRDQTGGLASALRCRLVLLRASLVGRSPARTAVRLAACLLKAIVAVATLAFIVFAVDLPLLLVGAMFVLPAIGVAAFNWILAIGIQGAAQRARIERTRRQESEQAKALAEARLALLQSQFDPDFLFNNLASLQFLMKRDPARADFMLSQLVQYLRLSASFMKCDNCTLGTQMELVDAFLQLAAIRMGKRVFVQVSCPPELKGVPFPPMVIHALVENALLHGAEPCLTPVMVQVRAYEMSGRLIVDVQDDGVGLGHTQSKAGGRGLRNVRTRLERVYGTNAQITVVEQPSGGVLARVEILQSAQGDQNQQGEPCDAQA